MQANLHTGYAHDRHAPDDWAPDPMWPLKENQ